MKVLILYHSEHHGNTEKVARRIAEVLDADLIPSSGIGTETAALLGEYDLVGFGSGIYYGRFGKDLENFVSSLGPMGGLRAFLFSTTGSERYAEQAHDVFGRLLAEKGFTVKGSFTCPGFDTALSAEGINRGRPSEDDFKKAAEFADGLKEN